MEKPLRAVVAHVHCNLSCYYFRKATNSCSWCHISLWDSQMCLEKPHTVIGELAHLHNLLFSSDAVFRRAMSSCWQQLWPTVALGKKMVALLPPLHPTLWLCTGMHRIVLWTLCKVGTVKHIASHLEGLKRNSEEIWAFVLCVCVCCFGACVFFWHE